MIVAGLLAAAWAGPGTPDEPGQPIPDRSFDVQHLDLAVRLHLDRGTVDGTVEITAQRRSPGPLLLHQRDLRIDRIELDGQPAAFRVRRDRLEVAVPADAQQVTVRVVYGATPRAGLHFRGIDDAPAGEARLVYSQGEDIDHRHWFPSWDHPSDRFTVTTHVEVPAEVGAWAIGESQGTQRLPDGWVRHDFRLDRPVPNYLVALAAGDLEEHPLVAAPVPMTVVVPGGQPVAAWTDATAVTPEVVAWLAERLDEPFPYPVYRSVGVTRFLYGGMENPGFVTLTDDIRSDAPGDSPLRAESVVAHEAAHQWFGDLVTTYGWRHMWLNEGFATYWAARWMEHAHGEALFAEKLRRWHERALRSDTPMAPLGARYDGRDHAKAYTQGASFLTFLEGVLGREALERGFAAYLDRHGDDFVESSDLRRVLEDTSGRSLGPWFDHFVHTPGHATLTSGWSWADGAVEVVIEQPDGADDRSPVLLPVEVAIAAADGTVHRRVLRVPGGSTRWLVELATEPRWVAVDPHGYVLAHWTRRQPTEAWARQAVEAGEAHARLEALAQLGEAADDTSSVGVLVDTLADRRRSTAERRQAALSLGKVPLSTAADALHAALDDDDVRVVRAVLDGLADNQEHADLDDLARRARQRRSDLDARALDTLSKLDSARAVPIASQWLRQRDPSRDHRFHGRAMDALARSDDPATLRLILPRLALDTPYWPLSSGLLAAAKLSRSLDASDPRRRDLCDRSLALLASRDHRVLQRVLHVLSMAGTPEVADRLAVRAATLPDWEDLPQRAREIAAALRDDGGDVPEAGPSLQELEARLDQLLERIERLERY